MGGSLVVSKAISARRGQDLIERIEATCPAGIMQISNAGGRPADIRSDQCYQGTMF